MSQSSSNKGKDASGKKFASLNLNQTFKGTKVENRSAAGQTRHGLQSLGKVSQSRRVPMPANLPSLKKENLGNDPTVSLVPSGSSGWGKKEKSSGKTEDQTQTPQQKPQKTDQTLEISLRPNAGAGLKSQSEQGKGWGNLQSGSGTGSAQSSNTFQREFPKLGVDGGGQSTEGLVKERESDEKEPVSSSTSNAPPRFGGEKWMPGQIPIQGPGQRPGGPPMNMPLDQQRPMFNGAQMQPPGGSQFYPYSPMPPYMMLPHPFPYPFPPNRMPPPGVMGQPHSRPAPSGNSSDAAERPATVKSEDLQGMDDNPDDEGWAGAQEDVDYNAKINFDESDEESDNGQYTGPTSNNKKDERSVANSLKNDALTASKPAAKDSSDGKPTDVPIEAWGELPPGYQGQMQFRHPHMWPMHRGPLPQGYPYPQWFHHGFRMPQMPQQRPEGAQIGQPVTSGQPGSGPAGPGQSPASPVQATQQDSKEVEKPKPPSIERRKRQEEDERKDAERREAAKAKLQALEEKMRQRDVEIEKVRRDSESSNKSGARDRLDSENSDSSRGGSQRSKGTKDKPPRFLKQQSQSKPSRRDETASSPASSPFEGVTPFADTVPRIMKRRDSLRSDDASSVHSHDSWANVSVGEHEKARDAEESVFVQETKRMEKVPEKETILKREGNFEKAERRGASGDGESKLQETSKVEYAEKSQESSQGINRSSRQSSSQSLSSKTQRFDEDSKARENRRSSKGSDGRRESNREYTGRDYRDDRQGRRDDIDWKDRSKESRQSREKEREGHRDAERGTTRRERDVRFSSGRKEETSWERDSDKGKNKKERDFNAISSQKSDVGKGKDFVSSHAKEASKYSSSKEASDRSQKNRIDTYKSGVKDERKQYDKVKDFISKQRPPSDNFKRLEKSKGKGVSMKSSLTKSDDSQKQAGKEENKMQSEGKKPSVWSQVVSGETNTENASGVKEKVEMQPKKSLLEIQKEEEIKESEKENLQSARNDAGEEKVKRDQDKNEEQDFQQPLRPPRDKKYDGRRGNDRYEDHFKDFQGRRRYEKDIRRPDERRPDERRPDNRRPDDRYGRETKQDQAASGYDSRRRGNDDRKRRHDETEALFPYEKIYSEEVEAEGRLREQKIERHVDRQYERARYPERTRGIRGGRQVHSRGRGRGGPTRITGTSKEGYNFPDTRHFSSKSFADKTPGSSDAKETPRNELEENQSDDVETKDDKEHKSNEEGDTDVRKGKEQKDFEQRTRENKEAWDYQDRYTTNRRDSRRGRLYSWSGGSKNGPRGNSKYESRHDGKKFQKAVREKNVVSGEGEKEKSEKDGHKDGDSEYEDIEEDDFGDEDEGFSDEVEIEGDADDAQRREKKETAEGKRGYREGKTIERGMKRGQSSRVQKPRFNREPQGLPPRFQKQKSDANEQRRKARGQSVRGARARGRASFPYRSGRGWGYGKVMVSRDTKSKSSHEENRDEDYGGDSDDTFHSADDIFHGSGNEDSGKTEPKLVKDSDNSRRYSSRGKMPSRGSSTRGRGARRGGNSDHFLGDRQQERVGHINASGLAFTLPAAGKASFPGNRAAEDKFVSRPSSSTKKDPMIKRQTADQKNGSHPASHKETQQEFAEPPKKMAKSKSIEKPDILRQFDVNNIASVVCIDDIPQNSENGENLSQAGENDGFVEVLGRKGLRERQKEEKKKLQEEMSAKAAKKNAVEAKETGSKPGRAVKVVEQPSQRVAQNFSQVTSQSPITSVSQSQASNAAMAAVGGWEPAQALLRGVQMVTQTEVLDGSKAPQGSTQPTMNAWKRPLSFAPSLANSTVTSSNGDKVPAPDPKAVGTGKPNSSPAKQLPLVGQVSKPNENVMVNGGQVVYNDSVNGTEHGKSTDGPPEESSLNGADKSSRHGDIEAKDANRKQSASRKADQRKINKGTKRETAPRFQGIAKAKANPILSSENDLEKKKISATAEDVSDIVFSKLKGEDRAPGKRPDGTKLRRCNSESSKEHPDNPLGDFEGAEAPTLSFMRADIRTEKMNGNEVKKGDKHAEAILNSLDNALGKVDVESHSNEEENAKDTARSVIKSLGDDDEKNLETRSLPSSTPPLVVEIHPPGPKGPSSDPGKGPVMTAPNSMSQEVNKMSMKVLSAKVLWDMPPSVSEVMSEASGSLTTWSGKEQTVVTSTVVTTSAVVESEKVENSAIKEHGVPTPVAVVTAQVNSKSEDDLPNEVPSDPALISKKTTIEQQNNVCKVKPQQKQQQQGADGKQVMAPFTHNQLFNPQFALQQPYAVSVQTSASHSKLQHQPYMLSLERADGAGVYPRERAVGEVPNHHAQPHGPVGLQQVRPASPLSHQQQDVLQPNVMLGNIYSTPALQGNQQNTLLWPISRHGMQPATTLSYMSQTPEPQQDLLSSPATFSSTPLYMTYDQSNSSVFSAQRLNSQLHQNPPVGLVLQQPQLRTASLLNVMQANQNSKGSSVFSMSSSPNPFQQASELQLAGMSQSDLTKHVHAKPFQPSSRTPPGGQSSQMGNEHQAHFLSHQHAKFSNINKLIGQPLPLHQHSQHPGSEQQSSSLSLSEKRPLLQHGGQQIQQQSHILSSHQQAASQHTAGPHQIRPLALQQSSLQPSSPYIHQHTFTNGRIASVGPRSVQGKTASSAASVQAQNRLGSMSPIDQNMHFIHTAMSSVKGIAHPQHTSLISNTPGNNLVQVLPQSQSLQGSQPQNLPFTARPSTQMQKYQRAVPGPIQRPVRPTSQVAAVSASSRPKQPVTPMVKTSDLNPIAKASVLPGQGNTFRNEEYQKMIEATKKYFAAQQAKNEASAHAPTTSHQETVSSTFTATSNSQAISARTTDIREPKAMEGKLVKPAEVKIVKPLENRPSLKSVTKSSDSKPSSKKLETKSSLKSSEVKESFKAVDTKDGEKSADGKKELPDVAASAMLNDPSDIISIIKGRPSLAKAFKLSEGQDKVSEKPQSKKSTIKDDRPKKSETHSGRVASSKGGQKTMSTKDPKSSSIRPGSQKRGERSERGRMQDKSRTSSGRGKSVA